MVIVLTKKEFENLSERGELEVTRGNLDIGLITDGVSIRVDSIKGKAFDGVIINPLDAGNKRLMLTIANGKELAKDGKTIIRRNGVTYGVFKTPDGKTEAQVLCEELPSDIKVFTPTEVM